MFWDSEGSARAARRHAVKSRDDGSMRPRFLCVMTKGPRSRPAGRTLGPSSVTLERWPGLALPPRHVGLTPHLAAFPPLPAHLGDLVLGRGAELLGRVGDAPTGVTAGRGRQEQS